MICSIKTENKNAGGIIKASTARRVISYFRILKFIQIKHAPRV